MKKGNNKKTFAYFEEIPHLKVNEYSSPAYIFKRFYTEVKRILKIKLFMLEYQFQQKLKKTFLKVLLEKDVSISIF